jgi:signal transduction histidine kinase
VVSVALAVLNHHWGVGWAAAVVSGVVSFAFGLLLRASVSGVVARAEAQARLIAELEATRAELAAASRAAGAAGERERLAREIHDTLAQAFTSVVMLLQAADAAIGSDDVAARRHVASAERTARDGLAEARALVAAGQPDDVTADALPAAIGRVAERVAAETGLRIEVAVEGEPAPLRPTAEVALLRTVQEALANVRKHAQASAVVVRLAYGADAAAVEVRDDGVGFATASPPAPSPSGGGFGLRGLRARLEELQGTVAVESAPGAGTTVRAVVAR